MLVAGEGRQAHNVRGAAVYMWESKQQAVFAVRCLQSFPPSLLSECLNPPNNGASLVYVTLTGHAFSTQTSGQEPLHPGGLA